MTGQKITMDRKWAYRSDPAHTSQGRFALFDDGTDNVWVHII